MSGQSNKTTPPGLTPICAIGASAGGVTALQTFFGHIRHDLRLAYVVVIHLAPDRPSQLGQILAACTNMPVEQIADLGADQAGLCLRHPPRPRTRDRR